MATKIMTCTCQHPYQDSVYGKQKRVHNSLGKAKTMPQYRCTVCDKVQYG